MTITERTEPSSRSPMGDGGHRRNLAPEEIEREIDRTRDAIGEDVKALQEKLSPEQLREDAREFVRESKERAVEQVKSAADRTYGRVSERARAIGSSAGELGRGTLSFASANAAPLTLLGLGAGILLLSRRRSRMSQHWYQPGEFEPQRIRGRGMIEREPAMTEPVRSQAQELASDVKESAREITSEVQEREREIGSTVESRAREVVHRAQGRAAEIRATTRNAMQRASDRTSMMVSENPLAAILATLALGAGLSLLISGMPGSSDFLRRVGERLQGTARQALGSGRDVLRRLGEGGRARPLETLEAPIETVREEVLAIAPS